MAYSSQLPPDYPKNVEEFKRYVDNQTFLLKKLRRNHDNKKWILHRPELEKMVIKRTHLCYEDLKQQVRNDYSMHEHFFTFCKENMTMSIVCKVLEEINKLFPLRPEAWKLAVDWYFPIDIEKAEQKVNKGLSYDPGSIILYKAAIELKLFQLTHITCPKADENSKINERNNELKVYVTTFLDNIGSLDHITSMLSTLEEHSATIEAQELILMHLFKKYAQEDIVWHRLAIRERKGIHFQTVAKEEPITGKPKCAELCVIFCIDKYKQGLTMVPEVRKKRLWWYYLETVIDMEQENHISATGSSNDFLKEALDGAYRAGYLDEKHCRAWVKTLPDKERLKNLEEATNLYPESEGLWALRLAYACHTDDITLANSTFKQGVLALQGRALQLWRQILRFHALNSNRNTIVSIYEDGIRQPVEVANALKPMYIDWLVYFKDMDVARERYKVIAVQKPYSKELHMKMTSYEVMAFDVDYPALMAIQKLACEQFGTNDVEVWLNYLKCAIFKNSDKDVKEDDKIKLSSIRDEAKERLSPHLWKEFEEGFARLTFDKDSLPQ